MTKKKGFSMMPGKKSPEQFDEFVKPTSNPPKPSSTEEMTKRITIDMTESMHRRLKMYAVQEGRPMNKILREWIENELEKLKG